jgi:hypothetical protein
MDTEKLNSESEAFAMAYTEFKCLVCNQPENRCTCIKYCAVCKTDYRLRLTEDGQFYCADCREACGYKTQDES